MPPPVPVKGLMQYAYSINQWNLQQLAPTIVAPIIYFAAMRKRADL